MCVHNGEIVEFFSVYNGVFIGVIALKNFHRFFVVGARNTEVDIEWSNNAVKEIALTNNVGTAIALKGRYVSKNADAEVNYADGITYIDAEKGKKYELIPERNTL